MALNWLNFTEGVEGGEITLAPFNATGVTITSAAAGAGVAVSAASPNANENLTLDAKGTGSVTVGGAANAGDVTIGNGVNDINHAKAAVALGGGAAPVVGTIGGAGPAVAAQNAWLRVKVAGVVSFIPIWR